MSVVKKKKALTISFIRDFSSLPTTFIEFRKILDDYPEFEVTHYNHFQGETVNSQKICFPGEIRSTQWDVIILHFSILYQRCRLKYYSYFFSDFQWLADSSATIIAMPQDEGNCPGILDRLLFAWGVDYIFSVHFKNNKEILYPKSQKLSQIIDCNPGYVMEQWKASDYSHGIRIDKRPLDFVYRGRPNRLRFGKASQMKGDVPLMIAAKMDVLGKKTDVSVEQDDRIYGDKWYDFLRSSKTVYAAPGGYTAVDFEGEIYSRVTDIESSHSLKTLDQLNEFLPPGWDSYTFLTITPRHFEAIACKTAQVLLRHHYKGVLEADRHYIALEHDFSNIDEVMEKCADNDYLQEIVDRARDEILFDQNYSFSSFKKTLYECIESGKISAVCAQANSQPDLDMDELTHELTQEKRRLSVAYHNIVLDRRLFEEQKSVSSNRFSVRRGLVVLINRSSGFIKRSYYMIRRPVARLAKLLLRR